MTPQERLTAEIIRAVRRVRSRPREQEYAFVLRYLPAELRILPDSNTEEGWAEASPRGQELGSRGAYQVCGLVRSADGSALAACGSDGEHWSCALSADGSLLAVSDREAILRLPLDGRPALPALRCPKDNVANLALAFSDDGARLAVAFLRDGRVASAGRDVRSGPPVTLWAV